MHHPTDRITHTTTFPSRGKISGEFNQWRNYGGLGAMARTPIHTMGPPPPLCLPHPPPPQHDIFHTKSYVHTSEMFRLLLLLSLLLLVVVVVVVVVVVK